MDLGSRWGGVRVRGGGTRRISVYTYSFGVLLITSEMFFKYVGVVTNSTSASVMLAELPKMDLMCFSQGNCKRIKNARSVTASTIDGQYLRQCS